MKGSCEISFWLKLSLKKYIFLHKIAFTYCIIVMKPIDQSLYVFMIYESNKMTVKYFLSAYRSS
jgi:hypothetical protein